MRTENPKGKVMFQPINFRAIQLTVIGCHPKGSEWMGHGATPAPGMC